jgi:class 3 adenylate cyclase
MDIVIWLQSLGLGKYEAAFRENEIDETVLPSLTHETLKELGVTAVGHRLKLLDAIGALRADTSIKPPIVATEAAPPPAATPTRPPVAEAVGERRHVTVMFCDLVGSTGISAALDAEDWRDLVGAYLEAASAAVTELGGHVAKKLGDGLMAPQECRVRQASAQSAHWHRNRPGGGRCGGRDLRRCSQYGGAGAGAGGPGHCRSYRTGAAANRRPFCYRGPGQPSA